MVPICPHQVKLGNLELYVEQESVPSTWYFLIALPILLAIVIVGKCPVQFVQQPVPRGFSVGRQIFSFGERFRFSLTING